MHGLRFGLFSSSWMPSGVWNGFRPELAKSSDRCCMRGSWLTALAVHMVHAFRARVVGLHLLVSDRPGRRDATVVPQLAEVGLAQAEQRGAVELRVAAHRVVRVR